MPPARIFLFCHMRGTSAPTQFTIQGTHVSDGQGLHVCGGVGQQEHRQATRDLAREQRRAGQVRLDLGI